MNELGASGRGPGWDGDQGGHGAAALDFGGGQADYVQPPQADQQYRQVAPESGTAANAHAPVSLVIGPDDRISSGTHEDGQVDGEHEEDEDEEEGEGSYEPRSGLSIVAKAFFAVFGLLLVSMVGAIFYMRFAHTPPAAPDAAERYRQEIAEERAGQGIPQQPVNPMLNLATPPSSAAAVPQSSSAETEGRAVPNTPAIPVPPTVALTAGLQESVAGLQKDVEQLRADLGDTRAALEAAVAGRSELLDAINGLKAEVTSLKVAPRPKERASAATVTPKVKGHNPKVTELAAAAAQPAEVSVCALKGGTDGSFEGGRPSVWIAAAQGERPERYKTGDVAPCIGRILTVVPDGEGWMAVGDRGQLRQAGTR